MSTFLNVTATPYGAMEGDLCDITTVADAMLRSTGLISLKIATISALGGATLPSPRLFSYRGRASWIRRMTQSIDLRRMT